MALPRPTGTRPRARGCLFPIVHRFKQVFPLCREINCSQGWDAVSGVGGSTPCVGHSFIHSVPFHFLANPFWVLKRICRGKPRSLL